MNKLNPIKIQSRYRAVMVAHPNLAGDMLTTWCDGAGAALEAALRDGIGREWVSVEDELPAMEGAGTNRISTAVLVCFGSEIEKGFFCDNGKWLLSDDNDFLQTPVTHWMPFPKMPEVRDAD